MPELVTLAVVLARISVSICKATRYRSRDRRDRCRNYHIGGGYLDIKGYGSTRNSRLGRRRRDRAQIIHIGGRGRDAIGVAPAPVASVAVPAMFPSEVRHVERRVVGDPGRSARKEDRVRACRFVPTVTHCCASAGVASEAASTARARPPMRRPPMRRRRAMAKPMPKIINAIPVIRLTRMRAYERSMPEFEGVCIASWTLNVGVARAPFSRALRAGEATASCMSQGVPLSRTVFA